MLSLLKVTCNKKLLAGFHFLTGLVPPLVVPPPPETKSPPFQKISRSALGYKVHIATNILKYLLFMLSTSPLD